MKKLLILTLIFLSGCANWYIPPEAKIEAQKNSDRLNAYVIFMTAGRTTREQDQNFIKAMRRAWAAQNLALNGTPLPPDIEAWFNYYDLMGQTQPEPARVDSIAPVQSPSVDWNALSR